MQTESNNDSKNFMLFLKRHWLIFALFVAGAALAFASAVYVFTWFAGNAQATSLVPSSLGSWSMAYMLTFILHLIFWEGIFIGIPVIIAAVLGWLWWKRLPFDERREYRFFDSSSSSDGGGAFSVLFWVAFNIKVYLDGNWNVPIATWTFDYVVNSSVTILVWALVLFGIPATIIGIIWWVHTHR